VKKTSVIVSLLMTYGDARISPNDYIQTKPRLWARETACARLSTASFMKMFLTCDFTVSGAILSSRAILVGSAWTDALENIALAGAQ
jgi:hypothetical protein